MGHRTGAEPQRGPEPLHRAVCKELLALLPTTSWRLSATMPYISRLAEIALKSLHAMGYSERPEWTAYQLCIDTAGRTERPSLLHNTVSWLNSFASVLSADGYSHSHRSISVRYGARMMGSWSATCFSTRPGRNGWPCKTQMEIWKRISRERLRDTSVQVRSIPKCRVRQGKVPKIEGGSRAIRGKSITPGSPPMRPP